MNKGLTLKKAALVIGALSILTATVVCVEEENFFVITQEGTLQEFIG